MKKSDPPNGVLGQALFWRKCLVLSALNTLCNVLHNVQFVRKPFYLGFWCSFGFFVFVFDLFFCFFPMYRTELRNPYILQI